MGVKFLFLQEIFWDTFLKFCDLLATPQLFRSILIKTACLQVLWSLNTELLKKRLKFFPQEYIGVKFLWLLEFFWDTFFKFCDLLVTLQLFGSILIKTACLQVPWSLSTDLLKKCPKSEKSPYSLHSLFARASRSLTRGSLREPRTLLQTNMPIHIILAR